MPIQYGYWTRRTERGYEKIPIPIYTDEQGRPLYMRLPNGRIKRFTTYVTQMGNTTIYHSPGGCEYAIATCPTQNWVWTGSGLGCIDPNTGKVIPLNHPVEDIFRKRPDVEDYLARVSPRTTGRYTSSSPSISRPAAQAVRQRRQELFKTLTPVQQPSSYREMMAKEVSLPPGAVPAPPPYMPPPGNLLWQLGMTVFKTVTMLAPPFMREIVNGIVDEYARQMSIVRMRLGSEKTRKYDYLAWRLRQYVNAKYAQYPKNVKSKIYKQLFKKYLMPQMYAEAGVDMEELTRSSPNIQRIINALGQAPDPRLQRAAELMRERIYSTKDRIPTKIEPATPDKPYQTIRAVPKWTPLSYSVQNVWKPGSLALRIAGGTRGYHPEYQEEAAKALQQKLGLPTELAHDMAYTLPWEASAELATYLKAERSQRPTIPGMPTTRKIPSSTTKQLAGVLGYVQTRF